MPKTTITITGDIEAFDRIDNFYKSMKRESTKMLKNWEIVIEAEYSEKVGEKPE